MTATDTACALCAGYAATHAVLKKQAHSPCALLCARKQGVGTSSWPHLDDLRDGRRLCGPARRIVVEDEQPVGRQCSHHFQICEINLVTMAYS